MSAAELLQVEWRAPAWWLIAFMPLLFTLLARRYKQAWHRYAEPRLQAWAIKPGAAIKHGKWRTLRTWSTWGFWLLLACALAGPRLPLETLETSDAQPRQTRHDMDVLIVLDVSPSMAATDIAPDRLSRAKLKLQDLAARLHGERIGLIVYSGEAGLLLPLTRDRQAFIGSLPLATPALFEDKGSYLAAALDLARRSFGDARRSRALLLLTDAEASSLSGDAGNAAVNAARALKAAGIRLYVLALASASGAVIPLADGGMLTQNGAQVISRPDLAGYGALADMTGGKITLVSDSDSDLATLYDHGLLTLPAAPDARDKTLTWRELFPYPLALALLLLLAGQLRFTRRAVLLMRHDYV